MLSIIVCIAENNAIGLRGDLLYHLRADLKRFKELTTGHTVVMGRRTFESLPKGALPNRRNIVLTRGAHAFPNTEVFPSLEAALKACAADEQVAGSACSLKNDVARERKLDEHVYIIGGSSVYAEALPLADELCLTLVHDTPKEADTFFPDFDLKEWEEVFRESHKADEQNDKDFTFIDLRRKK